MPTLSAHPCRLDSIAESTGQCNSCKDAQVIGPTMARDLIQDSRNESKNLHCKKADHKELLQEVAARSCCKKLLIIKRIVLFKSLLGPGMAHLG